MDNMSVSSRVEDNLKIKNKEYSLFGLQITHKTKTKEIEKNLKLFIFYLLNPDALQSSYKFKDMIAGYVPSKYFFGVKRWPLIQEHRLYRQALTEYEDKIPVKND